MRSMQQDGCIPVYCLFLLLTKRICSPSCTESALICDSEDKFFPAMLCVHGAFHLATAEKYCERRTAQLRVLTSCRIILVMLVTLVQWSVTPFSYLNYRGSSLR